MPKGRKGKKKHGGASADTITVRAGRFKLDMPMPRLPKWIGTPNLGANVSVYPRLNLDVPIAVGVVSVAAGAVAVVSNIDSSLIPNFATRFGATFKEFAIVGARFELRVVNTANAAGMVLTYIDENSNAAPTATAINYPHAEIPLTSTSADDRGSLHRVEWVARSYADLTWDAIGTSGIVGYLKTFASNAITGTGATTTATIMLTGAYSLCFRGFI